MEKKTNKDCEEYSTLDKEDKKLFTGYYIVVSLQKYYDGRVGYTAAEQFCDDYIGFKYHGGYLKNKEQQGFYVENYGKPLKRDFNKEEYIKFTENPNSETYVLLRMKRKYK